MKDLFKFNEELKIIGNESKIYLFCPETFKSGGFTTDELFKAFGKRIGYAPRGLNHTKKPATTKGFVTIEIELLDLNDTVKNHWSKNPSFDWDSPIYQNGTLVHKMNWENYFTGTPTYKNTKKNHSNRNDTITNGRAIDNTKVNEIIHTKKVGDIKIYTTPAGLDKTERSRMNANILFNEMFNLVHKKYHIIIVNGQKTGGVLYMHNKYSTTRTGSLNEIFEEVNKVSTNTFGVYPGAVFTMTEQGGLTKVPFGKTSKSVKKIL